MDFSEPRGDEPVLLAGFWRRITAALVDGLILGLFGWIIGSVFYDRLVEYGPYGLLIGLPIALLYSGLLNSRIAGGGTPGKHALGIRVVTRSGETIGIVRSLWRGLVYLVPFYVNGLDLSFLPLGPQAAEVALAVSAFLVFGIILSTFYLYLANWRTRQVVHDLAAGTFVVRKSELGRVIDPHINPLHLVVVAILFAISLAAVPLVEHFAPDLSKSLGNATGVDFDQLGQIQQAVDADPDVLSATATVNTTTMMTTGKGKSVTTSLVVTVIHRGVVHDPEGFTNSLADRVLRQSPDIMGRQHLTIVVRYGFDIGIASGWTGTQESHTAAEWRSRLQDNSKPA